MSGTERLITVAGSVALLLWGTGMARTGFPRAFGAGTPVHARGAARNRFRAAAPAPIGRAAQSYRSETGVKRGSPGKA